MEKHSLFSRLGGLPVPILPTMVGAITLGNMWSSLGFTWIRHLTMWAGILLLLAYILKIIFFFDLVKNEYRTTVPASLYAGFTMLLMLLGSYVFDLSPVIGKAMWALGLGLHTIHLLVFIYSHVFRKFE
ncbi:MAG: TDT family transporter, partial [Cellulosilyticaceae bacterium]